MRLQQVPIRANRALNIILISFLLIAVRVWHLAVVQHDYRVEQARRPQRRVVIERPERGTIRDRFNLPLAVNRMEYNASVYYAEIRDLPSVRYEQDASGKRIKRYVRKSHVSQLAGFLSEQLGLEATHIEDQIYSYAALFPQVPTVIKANISEGQYYKLKMAEKDWPGLRAEKSPKRHYPQGRVGSHLLGYIGAITKEEYEGIASEIKQLERYFAARSDGSMCEPPLGLNSVLEARQRLLELQERAYSLRDAVGKAGVEAEFDESLRGFSGQHLYLVDIYGNRIREVTLGRRSVSGQRVVLTISSELQQFAEELLIDNERIREGRALRYDEETRQFLTLKQPWIKGGAIVVLEPNSGQVLALASCPRFDPNDFSALNGPQIHRWLETETHPGTIWDGLAPLTREVMREGQATEEARNLTLPLYLSMILPESSPVRAALEELHTVRGAIALQRHPLPGSEAGFTQALEETDQTLLLDLCRLLVDERRFSEQLLAAVGDQPLSEYREANQATLKLAGVCRGLCKEIFHHETFQLWRKEHGEAFLKAMREEERAQGRYAKPYLDHFNKQEERLFTTFWQEWGPLLTLELLTGKNSEDPRLAPYITQLQTWAKELQSGAHAQLDWAESYHLLRAVIAHLPLRLACEYLASMRSYSELDRPLLGSYRLLRAEKLPTEQQLAAAFYPRQGFGYGRSWAYRQATAQGSVFKIVTSYAALAEKFRRLGGDVETPFDLNPLTIVDDPHRGRQSGWNVGFTAAGQPIPERYKGGRLLRTHRRGVGQIDLQEALEVSSNSYFGLLAGDFLASPEDLNQAAALFSYGARTGIDLPSEYGGSLPKDLTTNRSGLYSYAVGQHSLVATPLQTAVMLSSIANGGQTLKPRVVQLLAGVEPVREPELLFSRRHFSYQEPLERLGIRYPLFSKAEGVQEQPALVHQAPQLAKTVPMPDSIRTLLLGGLSRGVVGSRGNSRPSSVRAYTDHPWMVRDYRQLSTQIVGKTGTAETVEVVDLDPVVGAGIYNHIWFGAISFEADQIDPPFFGKPELVVVVYLRYGDWGKEAAPLAAQIVKKWREIKSRHASAP